MSLRVFVAMPFGSKPDSTGTPIDFDRIYDELIRPALEDVREPAPLPGGTHVTGRCAAVSLNRITSKMNCSHRRRHNRILTLRMV